MNKKILRKKTLSERKKLSLSDVTIKSDLIVDSIVQTSFFQDARSIACYYAYKNEVMLNSLLNYTDKAILYPRVVKGNRELDFYVVKSVNDFEKGIFGLMEPKISLPKMLISDINLFLTPGVAFSMIGERIGYGGGYYDTTLQQRNNESTTLGICFDIQIIPSGFAESWDQKVNGLITESGLVLT